MRLRSGVSVFGALLVGMGSLPVMAATFEVPHNFEIMYVDLESTGMFGNDFKAEVDQGEHQFVIRFNQRIGGGSDAEWFKSEPIIIDVKMTDQSQAVLKAPYFFQKSKAERYAEKPDVSLVDEGAEGSLDYQVRMLPKHSGFQVLRNYEEEVRRFTASYKGSNDAPTPAIESTPETEELEMLKFWYNKADATTRKDIRIWMIDSEHQASEKSTAFDMLTFWLNKASAEDKKAFQIWLLSE